MLMYLKNLLLVFLWPMLVVGGNSGEEIVPPPHHYNVGVGIADVTGPAAEAGMVSASNVGSVEI
jgi:hypothetical protein